MSHSKNPTKQKSHSVKSGKTVIVSSYTPLELGMKGEINNVKMEIIGYIRYREGDGSEIWEWEEFFLVGDDNRYYWIQYDADTKKYKLYKQLKLSRPIDTNKLNVRSKVEVSKKENFYIKEKGYGTIMDFKGEIPWKAKKGNVIKYADGANGYIEYAIEWDNNEIELYKGRKLKRKELFEAFKLGKELKKLEKEEQKSQTIKAIRVLLITFIFINFITLIGSLISGRVVFEEKVTLCEEKETSNSILDKKCTGTDMPLGPFELNSTGRVHRIYVRTETAGPTDWEYVETQLLDSHKKLLTGFGGDFWYDDGESNYSATKHFRLTEKGKYYLNLELYKDKSSHFSNEEANINVKVYENVILSRYFIILIIGAFITLYLLGIKIN